MKTDSVSFTTNESVDQIADKLRMLANQLNASVDRIAQDSFGGYGAAPGEIEVVMWGHVGLVGGLKHFRPGSANNDWGVQVYVFNQGAHREIELVALGESVMAGGLASNGTGILNLGASKEKRDKIAQVLRPVNQPSTGLPTQQGMPQQGAGINQPVSYTQLTSSGQPSGFTQTSNMGQSSSSGQNLDPAASQNFESLQEMIKNFESRNK